MDRVHRSRVGCRVCLVTGRPGRRRVLSDWLRRAVAKEGSRLEDGQSREKWQNKINTQCMDLGPRKEDDVVDDVVAVVPVQEGEQRRFEGAGNNQVPAQAAEAPAPASASASSPPPSRRFLFFFWETASAITTQSANHRKFQLQLPPSQLPVSLPTSHTDSLQPHLDSERILPSFISTLP